MGLILGDFAFFIHQFCYNGYRQFLAEIVKQKVVRISAHHDWVRGLSVPFRET